MSRGNVFKLSGNMALNSNNPYSNQDISEIKNSLRLLKQKQNLKKGPSDILDSNLGYNAPINKNPKSEQNNRINQNQNNNSYGRQDMYGYEMQSYTKQSSVASYKQLGKQKNLYQDKNNRNQERFPTTKNTYEDKNQYYPSSSKLSRNPPKNYNGQLNSYDNYDYQQNNVKAPQSKNLASNKGSYNYNQYPSKQNKMEKPIRQANRQNKVDIVQYDPRQFVQCRQGCGRKFNPDSISKHESICKTVFQKKRKEFDSQKHRIVQKEQVKLMKKGEQVQKKLQMQKANQKIPKWKAQSMALRVGLKQNKNTPLTAEEKKAAQLSKQAEQNSKVRCPHCGRSFNETAGPRHIEFCGNKQKNMVNKKKK